jgi:hypothetical protein
MRMNMMFAAALLLIASACNAAGTNQSVPSQISNSGIGGAPNRAYPNAVDHTSVLKLLTNQVVIGSTVDPTNGDQNPYGLVYVNNKPFGKSVLKKGDLVACNFNDQANVQGNGTTVEYMTSTPGSSPKRFIQNSQLKGCASLVINSFDEVFAANSGAKNATALTASGKILQTLKSKKLLVEPWGSAYVTAGLSYPPGDGLWVADASSGKIIRINLGTANGIPTYTAVISGFAVNHGKPGSILGPSGMQYIAGPGDSIDTLYVVDGVTNTLVAFKHAYNDLNGANSIVVGSDGKTFSGPKKGDARLVYSGSPLNGPISSTLLHNGNLVIGNTLDPNGTNLLVEIATDGTLLDTKNVDTGIQGALFGIVSTGTSDSTEKIYFNDDNANNIQLLEK